MRLLAIDGDHLVNRYARAFGPDGPEASLGFALGRYRRMADPTHAVLVFDNDDPTWRHRICPTYKADREDPPPQVADLFVAARRQARYWGLPVVTAPTGYEADDLIASYVDAAIGRGWRATIVSGDKDLTQLIREAPRVRMLDEIRGWTWDSAKVAARFGVQPEQMAGYLALAGDASDGFSGVPGIGPKTAAALLRDFGSFAALMDRRNLITRKATYEAMREHADAAETCYRLAVLRRDVALPVPLERLAWGIGRGRGRSVRA